MLDHTQELHTRIILCSILQQMYLPLDYQHSHNRDWKKRSWYIYLGLYHTGFIFISVLPQDGLTGGKCRFCCESHISYKIAYCFPEAFRLIARWTVLQQWGSNREQVTPSCGVKMAIMPKLEDFCHLEEEPEAKQRKYKPRCKLQWESDNGLRTNLILTRQLLLMMTSKRHLNKTKSIVRTFSCDSWNVPPST